MGCICSRSSRKWQEVFFSEMTKFVQVGLKKYASVSPTAFGIVGRKRLAVIRATGPIVGGTGGP